MSNKAHVIKVAVLVIFVVAGYLIFKKIMKPKSFFELGHYRKDAITDELLIVPINQGQEVCTECHNDVGTKHKKDVHGGIECFICHGDGKEHVLFYSGGDDTIPEEKTKMPKDYTLEGCLYCHRKLAARPIDFPQVNKVEHFKMLGVTDMKTNCIACHSPHEPLYLKTEVSNARIHPIIKECRQCHENEPTKDYRDVLLHPVIFTCSDCHAALVRDFKSGAHAITRCTICHQSHPENESSERIFKNANSRFCLLCHQSKSFKDPNYPPKIEPKEHASDLGISPEDLNCVNCHMADIHPTGMIIEAGGKLDEKN